MHLQAGIEIPYNFAQSVLYTLLVYALINFQWTAAKFFYFFYFTFCCLLYFTYFGLMTVAITPDVYISTIITAGFLSLWNLFSGFMIPRVVSILICEKDTRVNMYIYVQNVCVCKYICMLVCVCVCAYNVYFCYRNVKIACTCENYPNKTMAIDCMCVCLSMSMFACMYAREVSVCVCVCV